MTFARTAGLALLVLWGLDALFWGHQVHPAAGWLSGALRVAMFCALAVAAWRSGRRWTAPLRAWAIALLAILGPFAVGVFSGAFTARGVRPGFVWGYVVAWTLLALLAVLGTTLVLAWRGRAVRD